MKKKLLYIFNQFFVQYRDLMVFVSSILRNRLQVLILIGIGFFIHFPSVNFISFLIQGDVGIDLYNSFRTMNGGFPYRDYFWAYGPLMPYYYAACFKILGVVVSSLLIGQILLYIVSGVLVFYILILFVELPVAFLGAVWFWTFNQEFGYTFNHAGGILLVLFIIYCFLRIFLEAQNRFLYYLCGGIFLLLLTKINIGIFMIFAVLFCLGIVNKFSYRKIDNKRIIFLLGLALCTAAVVYLSLLWGLPKYRIFQSLPLLPNYDQFGRTTLLDSSQFLVQEIVSGFTRVATKQTSMFMSTAPYYFFLYMFIMATGWFFYCLIRKGNKKLWRMRGLVFFSLIVFILVLSIEFILTAVSYRLFWPFPIMILLGFFLFGTAVVHLRPFTKISLYVIFALLISIEIAGKCFYKDMIKSIPGKFISLPRAMIYVKNPSDWIDTVVTTTEHLQKYLKKNETFLAIPHEPLYYYLTGRNCPVPETVFYDFINVTSEQEDRVIQDLEAKHVNVIVLSSRSQSNEKGLGHFGESYGKKLAMYMKDNFTLIESIGDWRQQPAWIWPHATRIYKRVQK